MANPLLFRSLLRDAPLANAQNHERAVAFAFTPRHKLAQMVMTGCMNETFYASGQAQLSDVLGIAKDLDDLFLAKLAIYGRERGMMKDMPALLTAILAARGSALLPVVFARVINNGRMLRNFVQILRSGATGRRSLGTRPKKLVQRWLQEASEDRLLQASVGNVPSLADIVKMVHPRPQALWQEAFFARLIGKPCDKSQLPEKTQALLAFREGGDGAVLPDVPFLLLTNSPLSTEQWAQLAQRMSWQTLRMNLNTLARHGVFDNAELTASVAKRLADRAQVRQARVYPYQLLSAWSNLQSGVPQAIGDALEQAMEFALENVPQFRGNVVVCPDVSGSMRSSITGYRQGATSKIRCVDVAGLIAAAVLRNHPQARVLPFECDVVNVALDAKQSVMRNAQKLAAVGGGGTNCSAPLRKLLAERARVDLVIMVSDNESWIDKSRHGSTATMECWAALKKRNPLARLVCIDLLPYGTTQAAERGDILNVGGFSDEVFTVIDNFVNGRYGSAHWLEEIESVTL
ncbi:TROVE domain-containing protein [Salmonella enterica subsp. indica]|uniref:TROVE domain-containing protein n=2 Tax=Salmonella enterica TaxID=28901 RepID=A0A5Y2QKV0_SALER|nr:TROVE domain-containing protein [Salmonella enterica]ECF4922994.1 TROVE domain-containing protein [Salmonella enterica subsp. arizonae]HAC6573159.1 TROVE domain-containing protein [Salmonella enterica subsp. indica]HAE8193817.1 TROVE domain-containing protein [Salmonella enterica subsp. indica serovar 41:b:1,7]ECI9861814.1 TROVE domain-containing protein [Salmonella enterica subsp. arizonae]HAU3219986.1 TROVE domain-containing protein [Salmonella enterica subsp. indica]